MKLLQLSPSATRYLFVHAIRILFLVVLSISATQSVLAQAAFQVTGMTNASAAFSVDLQTAGAGDDRAGIAVTPSWVYRVQDGTTVRMDPTTHGINSLALPRRDGIFSDLATGQLWTLWNGASEPISGSNTAPFSLTAIRQMDADLNILGAQVNLSTPITVDNQSMIFAGRGFFIIWRSGTQAFFAIDIATGNVTTLGTANLTPARTGTENWLAWGIAEFSSGVYSVLYRGAAGTINNIMRRNASTGVETTAFTFTNLGDCGDITISPWHNRWYGFAEGGSQFTGTGESLFSATASMVLPPPPTISSFVPTNAAPGQTVTINGTNLGGLSAVNFGGVAAATITPISAVQATAVVHDGASGNVSLVAIGGSASLAGFTYNASPVQTLYASRSSSNLIGSIRTDGSMSNPTMTTGNFPRDVFRQGSYIYWANETGNAIGRANADGSSPNPNFITGCSSPNGVYATATNIYWTNYGSTTIGRANIDGTGVNQSFCNTGLASPVGITIDEVAGQIYWARTLSGAIGKVAIDGVTGLNGSFITGLTSPGGMWTDNTNNFIYWTESGASNAIRRAQLSTGTGVTTLVTGCSGPVGLTSDGSFLYWSNPGTGNIGRSLLSGAGANQAFATGFTNIRGVAIGPNPVPGASISGFVPATGQSGAIITINGANFIGVTDVRIGNQSVAYTVISPTQITATVPVLGGGGLITVLTAANGTGTSATGFGFDGTYVVGQPNFVSAGAAATSTGLNFPEGVAVDVARGKLYIADRNSHRVVRYAWPVVGNTPVAQMVFGQPNLTSAVANSGGLSASSLNMPIDVVVDPATGDLWVAEFGNNRILRFAAAHSFNTNQPAATQVLGQANFITNAAATTQSGLNGVHGLDLDASGRLWVADIANNRVLRFDNAASLGNGANASAVLGQALFTSNAVSLTQNGMNNPHDVALDAAGNLFVADLTSNRILRFNNAVAKANGANADGVLGQTLFTTNAAAATATGLNSALGLAVSPAGDLFVCDRLNRRVLVFNNAAAKVNGAAADRVLGQTTFTTNAAATTQAGMNEPRFATFVSGDNVLLTSDFGNNRVVLYGTPTPPPAPTVTSFLPTSAIAGATVVITGTNFLNATVVQFGGTNAASFVVNSSTQITAVVGAGASGNVSVTTPGGSANQGGFTFLAPPTISGFVPATAQAGATITINGNGFTGATSVQIGNQTVAYTVVSATQITATVPILGGGGVISVTTPIGTGSSATGFGFNGTFVVGQPNFTSSAAATTSTGLNFPEGIAVDVTNGKLYVADRANNRILRFAWPVVGNAPVAQIVFGQPNFTGNGVNSGGLSASSLNSPVSLTVDQSNGDLWVADAGNNRVLRFAAAHTFNINQPSATQVLGQPNFTSNAALTTQSGTNAPHGVALETGGRLWVADYSGNRILRFDNATSLGNGANASGVLGQPNFTSNAASVSQAGLTNPASLVVDAAGNLYVSDNSANRVLRYNNAAAKANGANADAVLGQAVFTTNSTGLSPTTMNIPLGLALSPAGDLFVADQNNRRVLVFNNAPAKANGAAADRVLGQTSFTANGAATTQSGMNQSRFLAFVPGDNVLISSEWNNNRVVLYGTPTPPPAPTITGFLPTSAIAGATVVITGTNFNNATVVQFGGTNAASFVVNSPTQITAVVGAGASGNVSVTTPGGSANLGGFTFLQPPTISGFAPTSAQAGATITINGANFTGATQVLIGGTPAAYTVVSAVQITATVPNVCGSGVISVTTPIGTGTSAGGFTYLATYVLGQTNFTTGTPGTLNNKFNTPNGMAIDAANNKLYVAEFTNHRVMRFSLPITQNSQLPEAVFGQVNFTSGLANGGGGTNAAGFNGPFTMNVGTGGNLWITDILNNRVVMIPAAHTAVNGASATMVLGQPNLTSNAAGLSAQNISSPYSTRLDASGDMWVADNGNRRVLQFTAPLSTFQSASVALGVPDFVTNNVVLPTSTRTGNTGDIAIVGTSIYVSDIANHRILRYNAPYITGMAASVVLGQPGMTTGLANNPNSTLGLNFVQDLYTNGTDLFAADVVNNRVLVYLNVNSKTSGAAPDAVIGQPDFTTVTSGLTQAKLNGLRDVAITGAGQLIIADQGNNRVLVFGSTFATPVPTVASFLPTSALAGATIVIRGTNFTGTTQVQFGGVNATSFTVISATEISAVVAAGGASGNVSVTTPAGTGSLAGFAFTVAPTAFSAATPPIGTVGNVYTYTFVANGSPAPTYAVQSGTLPAGLALDAATGVLSGTPTGAGGTVGPIVIRATNVGGFVDCAPFNITINAAPTAFTAQAPPIGVPFAAYTPYSFVANGFPTPTYAVQTGGALPVGMTLSGAGVLSGTPSVGGVFGPYTVRATNIAGTFDTAPFTITLGVAPTAYSAQTPPSGALGLSYSYIFTANGIPTPTYAVQSGMLPAGLSLNAATGEVSGIPTATGTFGPITIRATNIMGTFDTAPFTIAINTAPSSFSAQTPPNGTVGAVYNYFYAANGTPSPTYSLFAGTLPPGVFLNAATGQLIGTPTIGGTYSGIIIRASNVAGAINSAPATISVIGAPTVFTAAPVSGVVGTPYSFTFSANGFPAPAYSLASGVFPPGLTLNSVTGELSGTPTTAGVFGVTVISASNAGGSINSNSFSITIAGAPSSPTAFTAQTPGTATSGTPYNYTFAANGFPSPTFSVVSGTLPPGLTLNPVTGQVTGTPTVSGAYGPITIQAANGSGNLNSTPFTITVNGAPTAFSAQTPGNGVVGTPYFYALVANGLPAPAYTLVSGTLPTGLTLSGAGVISGTPTAAGTFGPITVQASNGAGSVNSSAFSITITGTGSAPTLFTAQSPPNGLVSTAYAYTFVANGSPAPSYAVNTGTLPPGLTLTGANGLLSGVPTASGVFGPITLTATNGFGSVNSAPFNITVNEAPTAFTAQTPPSGAVGTAYNYTVVANGYPAPTYTLVGGSLPAGLTLSPSGVISGTPTGAGTSSGILIRAQNAFGNVNTVSMSIVISATLVAPTAFTAQTPPSGNLSTPYSYTIAANGSPSPTYSIFSGTLPTGLTLNAVTGEISGTPTVGGAFGPIVIQASNGAGMLNTTPINITINQAPPTITNFTPTGSLAGATITINGTNLTGVTAVSFGGVAAASFTPVSATQVTAVVAAGGATGNVNLTTPGGTAVLGVYSFFVPPTITSFTPMVTAVGVPITITGTGFTGATQVQFGGVNATSFTVVSPTQITAIVPLGAPNMPISVTTPGGIANSAASFMLVASASEFYYQAGAADNPANWNTLPNGGGLTASGFSTAGQSFYVSNARTAIFSANASIGAGVTMQVENGSALAVATGRTLTNLGSLRINAGGRLRLEGTGAVAGVSNVQYLGQNAVLEYRGGNNRPTSDIEFSPSFSASLRLDSASVRLNNSKNVQGVFTAQNASALTFGANNGLTLGGEISLNASRFGTDSTNTLTIAGSGTITGSAIFDNGSGSNLIGSLKLQRTGRNLTLGGNLRISGSLSLNGGNLIVPSGQTLLVTNTADTALQGGSVSSFVAGALSRELPASLTPADTHVWGYPIGKGLVYLPAILQGATTGSARPVVALEAFNVQSGGSTGIGLTGALSRSEYWTWTPVSGNFTGARIGLVRLGLNDSTRVAFASAQAGMYQNAGGVLQSAMGGQAVVSDGVPSGAIGTQRFFALAGAAAAPGDTTPILLPKITRFFPDRGTEETVVTVIGENFTGINSVAIGTLPVGSFRVLSSTGISITVGAVRTGPIQIGGPNGGTASSTPFTLLAAPVIQSVSPQMAGPGATVTITGQNLEGVTTLTFGGVTITNFTINPNGTITFVVPPGATAGATSTQIRLNADGGMTQATTSVVFVPQAMITGFSPATETTGATITIRGTNFVGVQSVRFGTDSVSVGANFTANDSTRISVIVPARVAGMGAEVPVRVILAGGVRITAPNLFMYKNTATSSTSGSFDLTQLIDVTEFVDKIVGNGGEVRVRGSNLQFINDISVRTSVSAGKAEYRISSSGQITLLLPKQNLLSGTGGTVSSSATSVVFLGAYNSLSFANAFSIISTPEVATVTPSEAGVGEEIVITGKSLDLVTAVTIGGTNATFRLEGSTRLVVRMPARPGTTNIPLSGRLNLLSVGGINTATSVVINTAFAGGLPSITSFSPASGSGGTIISVTGANLSAVSAVRVGDIPAAAFTLLSPTVLSIRLPAGVSRVAEGLLTLTAPSGDVLSRTPFVFTESLQADSAKVMEFARMLPAGGTLLNWRSNTPITEWDSVRIVGNRIVGIRLPSAGLRGTIPSGLAALTQLQVLDISGNAFTGGIPSNLTALSQLEEFIANRNQLSGTLPSAVVCSWRRLRRFDVSNNSIGGEIPACLSTLENGETINLSGNQFTGQIPVSLASMPNLRELRLSGNRLTGRLPREFGTVGALRALATAQAKTSAQLTQAQTLQVFDVSNNELEGEIPQEWSGIVNIREMSLSNNRLSGAVPRGIAGWQSLTVLRLANNDFSGELPSGVQWNNLLEINIENNRFTGALPLELSQSSRLRTIRAANNALTALPNLSKTRIDTLLVENNRLEFGSLEPITKLSPGVRHFRFIPQARLGTPRDTILERGAALVLPSGIGGASTVYQWYKDSSLVRGSSGRQATFRVDSAIRVNSGVYFCRATNPALPGLTLETASISVSVASVDVLLAVPEVITPVSGAINVSPNLTLRWTRVEGATDYEVRWWKLQGGVPTNVRADTLAQPDSGESIYVLRGLERGAEYEWRVRALIRNDRGAVSESGNATQNAYFRVVVAGVDLAFSTVDAGKSTIADERDVPGGVLINVSSTPLTIIQNGLSVVSRDGSFRVKTQQVAGIVRDTTLQPNGELALGIEFTPLEAEPVVASLMVNYRDGQNQARTVTFADAFRGRGSALAMKPVDFDTVRAGKATVQSIEITNRSTIHTMQIQAVRILTVRGAPAERAFTLRDASDLLIAPRETAYILIRCATNDEGVRRAGVRLDAISTRDTSLRDVAVTSITAFARLPKLDDAAVSLRVRAVPDSAAPGSLVRLNVYIEDATQQKLKAAFEAAQPEIRGRVQFNRQVLSLASGAGGALLLPDPTGSTTANVLFNTRWEGRNAAVMTIEARAVAGITNKTPLKLASIEWGTSATARLPWEKKVFVEESVDSTLAVFIAQISSAGGRRLIAPSAPALALTAIAPNPAKEQIEVAYTLPETDIVTAVLVDARGNEVQRFFTEVQSAGQHKASLKLGWVASGSYILRFSTSKEMITGRVEVVR